MLVPDINPIIYKIGNFQLTYYSLVYILGFLSVLFILFRVAKRNEINLSKEEVYDFLIFTFIALLIGARVFHILFWDFSYFYQNPLEIPKIWRGGLSFHGGLLGSLVAIYIYTKRKKIDTLKILDILTLPILFALALGRIANFVNQEIVGTITSSSLCIQFQKIEGCRQPIQLYAAAGRFMLFFFILVIKNKFKNYKTGFLFWLSLFLISIGRFALDFVREDARYLALTIGQWFSIILALLGFFVLITRYKEEIRFLFRL